jgi:hypothetical protein
MSLHRNTGAANITFWRTRQLDRFTGFAYYSRVGTGLSSSQLAKALGCHKSYATKLIKRGCPRDPVLAEAWITANIKTEHRPTKLGERQTGARRQSAHENNSLKAAQENSSETADPKGKCEENSSGNGNCNGEVDGNGDDDADMAPSIRSLRLLEQKTAAALCRALDQDRVSEVTLLRRDHTNVLRALNATITQKQKFDVARGKLVPIDLVFSAIKASFREGLMALRRLPDLGRDIEEKARLTSFLNETLEAFRRGFADGLQVAGRQG